ncbi:hypothetical protein KFL82_004659 [Salmonella enterica]|nr:hypothetical protein [Salmonella enterica]EHL6631251.1 hypothetical protein [Salmonella enterica]EHL6881111.1 hypothetical protein [Salmonella enterica]EHL6909893.1 hypothetical protein [Salmonella enterica]EIB2628719.1 hypothetical protein [Salmonella enterica]
MDRLTTDGLTMNQLAERNAEHVTTIAALEARCAALAAENAGLKAAIDSTIGWQQSTDPVNVESVKMLVDIETPATDAFLAEVRAQGVEMFAVHCQKRHGEMLKTEPNEPVSNESITATRRAGEFALYFATQLRKGGTT